MPTLTVIDGVKIQVYSRDHLPPHFHAQYAEDEELIEIETLNTYRGSIPRNKRKKVIEWANNHKSILLQNFTRLNPNL